MLLEAAPADPAIPIGLDSSLACYLRSFPPMSNTWSSDVQNQDQSVTDMLEMKFQEIERLTFEDKALRAREIIARIKADSPDPLLAVRYIRARMCEERMARKVDDLDSAIRDFSFLIESRDSFVAEGLVGRARVLYRKDPSLYADEALELCIRAVDMERNVLAMMLMAAIYMDKKHDAKMAKKWALRAFRNGSIWGGRYIAVIAYRRKSYAVFIFWKLMAFFSKPFLLKRYELRGPFK